MRGCSPLSSSARFSTSKHPWSTMSGHNSYMERAIFSRSGIGFRKCPARETTVETGYTERQRLSPEPVDDVAGSHIGVGTSRAYRCNRFQSVHQGENSKFCHTPLSSVEVGALFQELLVERFQGPGFEDRGLNPNEIATLGMLSRLRSGATVTPESSYQSLKIPPLGGRGQFWGPVPPCS